MPVQQTFAIIKPDAVRAGNVGGIVSMIEAGGFAIRAMKKLHMTQAMAEGFYAVHKERPFFKSLVAFMTSGPAVVLVLEKEDAVKAWRDLMGATDPAKAAEGTVRKKYGANIENNASHGSDSDENAAIECAYFFSRIELS
ncbi:MAG: nucleoside-diphosphate kinase [Candidatus Methylomirabilis sp.]|nr:nucleoside-diphosphate kinase [Deltaproteobacteria bacterium]